MFSASRNSVSNSSVVGNTLNSTGRPMYIATIITMTDIMMSITIRKSSTKLGSGVISAMTIAKTAMGTASSPALDRPTAWQWSWARGAGLLMARACAMDC